ncbi:MAG: phosphopyruvate hydratase [Deltaproteobacteria bacterium]
MAKIQQTTAREILDSRGNPTLEVEVLLNTGDRGVASVPSGASTGKHEAIELRDGDPGRYGGKGVRLAVGNVAGVIAEAITGLEAAPASIDARLLALDGTEDKHRLGGNAMLGVSLAVARAAAHSHKLPLYRTLGLGNRPLLPVPMFNVLNGGAHADNRVDCQEFMIAPVGAKRFSEALRMAAEVYHALKDILRESGRSTGIGDEGGFAPDLRGDSEALELILSAIERSGLSAPRDVVLALDPAASELYDGRNYLFRKSGGPTRSPGDMVELYEGWVRQFPIWSIEDGLAEDDWEGWRLLTGRLGGKVQLVGDDIFVTNPTVIARAQAEGVANAALIKLNQIGTLTETLCAIRVAREGGYGTVVSHRSGETTDDFIADLSVGAGAGQIKSGAPCRGERVAKYNRLLRIEEELGGEASFAGERFVALGGFLAAARPAPAP